MAMNTSYFDPPINMDRVCRICLVESTNLSSIFCNDQQEVNDFSGLLQKIQLCGSIEIHENDGFPSLICDVCIYKVSIAHEFRQQCQQSDARLRLIYDKPSRTTDITETCTQTEPQTRIILTRKMATPPSAYYVKEELQSSNCQTYASAIEAYTVTAGHHGQEEVVTRQEPMDCREDEKIFLCDIGYDATKDITEKSTTESSTNLLAVHHHHQHAQNHLHQQHHSQNHHQHHQHHQQQQHHHHHHHHQMELPLEQVELTTTTLVTVNAAGELLETRELIVKEDDGKCNGDNVLASENDDAAEYLNEQLLNSNTVDDCIAPDPEDFEDQQQKAMIMEQQDLSSVNEKDKSLKIDDDDKVGDYSDSEDICGGGAEDDSYFASLSAEAEVEEKIDVPSYKCNVCLKSYTTEKALANHNREHEKNYKCEICQKLFFKLKNMERHRKIHDEKRRACRECHASFSKLSDLTRHVKSQHGEKMTKLAETSESCANEERTTKLEDCASECETTNDNEEFNGPPGICKCEVCGRFCSSLKNLKRHSLIHGDKKYSCEICKKSFFRADTLKKHAEKHGQGLLDNLPDENKLYGSNDDEDDDEEEEEEEGDDDEIETSFDMANGESAKIRDETNCPEEENIGEFKCQHCNKVMATKKGLRRHVTMHKPKAEPVTCPMCKKICASQARLALHVKTHAKPKEKVQREYLCHICSKVYPSNSSLTYHMRTHTGVKPHVCKICNSGFTTTTSLANHIRIHTGDKPFVCHVCTAAFAVSSAFRRHLTRHTGEANYLCKTCGKAFKRLSTLKEHTYTHSGEKPYVCKTCGAAYSHSGSLFAHQKRCRLQYGETGNDQQQHHTVAHHIHVDNVQTAVRSLAVIGQIC